LSILKPGRVELPLTNSLYVRAASLLAVALVVYAQLAAPAGSEVRPSDLFFPFFCYPPGWTMTIFLMIVMSPADRRDLAILIAVCAGIGASVGLAVEDGIGRAARDAAVMAGLAPYAFSLARIGLNTGSERSRWIDLLAVASLVHVTSLCIPYFRDNTAIWLPRILDANIARLDEALGAQPSALMAIAFLKVPVLGTASLIAYTFVQLPITIVAAWQWKRKAADELSVLPAFMIGSIVGFTCYWLAPAIGPKVYFAGQFPLLHATPDYLDRLPLYDFNPHHPRNDMPSMHFSWAVMTFLFTRGFPVAGRVYTALFVFFTFCATIGLGEHYLADLIVGTSLVLMVRGLTAARLPWRDPDRLRAVLIGFAMLSAWIAAIHAEAPIPAPLTVLLSLGTVGAAIVFERALARAEGRTGLGRMEAGAAARLDASRFEVGPAPTPGML
jgi:PAP2 superfamily